MILIVKRIPRNQNILDHPTVNKKRAAARDNCSLNFEKDKVQRLKSKSQFISEDKDTKKSLEINII